MSLALLVPLLIPNFGGADAAALARQLYTHFSLSVDPSQIEILGEHAFGTVPATVDSELQMRALGLRFDRAERIYEWSGERRANGLRKSVPVRVRFRLPKLSRDFVLIKDKRPGTLLNPEDFRAEPAHWLPRPGIAPRFPTEIARLECRRALRAGHILRPHDLALPPTIRRGESVAVTSFVGKAVLRYPAISARSGTIGDTITIRRPGDFRLVPATVLGPGLVEVLASAGVSK
jgi:hypothetical protein